MAKDPKMMLVIGGGKGKEGDGESHEGSFKAPEGMDMEGKKPGDTVQAVCDLEIEADGRLCVKKVNGMDVPGYEEEESKEQEMGEGEKPSYKGGFTNAVMPPDEDDLDEGSKA